MKRTSLKFESWPPADRAMWQSLFMEGNLLDGAGPLAHWADETRTVAQRDYGYWLNYLLGRDPSLATVDPAARVSADRVRDYCQTMENVSARTRAGRIARLLWLVRGAKPEADFAWLAEMKCALDRRADSDGPVRAKHHRLRPSGQLIDAGLTYAEQARDNAQIAPWKRARQFCDGLMIAFLATRPLRIKNFVGLCLGRQLLKTSSGYLIDIPGSECKTSNPIVLPVPDELCPFLDEYFETHRPHLVAGLQSDHVWLTTSGKPYRTTNLSQRLAYLTQRLVGTPISAHLFRDCAATTIAIEDPQHVYIIAPLLGQTNPRTSEDHYNHANQLEANRRIQACIKNRRKLVRPVKRRPAR